MGVTLGRARGENSRGTIIGYATGDVTGTGSSIGGLVGDGGYSTFIGYATGDVTGTGSSIGGLVDGATPTSTKAMPREMSLGLVLILAGS